jgi:DNA helicase-2/ATP-dependent DNA helicase PcrA
MLYMVDLAKLNKEQQQAVTHGQGPLLIVAGAGTGKTTVITDRIAYLIETEQAKPEEILAVTFTEKAASEMEERVDRILAFGYQELWISTFHAFSERILKDNGLDIGLPTNFKLLDQTAAWLLLRQHIDQLNLKYYKPLGNPNKFLKALVDHFSRCKDQMIYPQDYWQYSDNLKTNLTDLPEATEIQRIQEIAEAYHTYQRLLLENNLLDFGDLINYCLQLFQKRPVILQKYQQKFGYILVDEFQDTNKAQYELIKILSQPRNNLTVCADDDQAIYRFRGASVTNIKQFKQDFPQAKEVCLVKNYRSSQNILDLAYSFIQANNPNRLEYLSKIDKKLQAQTKESGLVEYLSFKSLNQEAKAVAEKIVELLKKDPQACLGDFAILTRANDSALPFARALDRAGVPYQFLASRGLYQKPAVLNVISYLKLLDNYHESAAFYRLLNLPFLDIKSSDIMLITRQSQQKAQSVYETLQQLALLRGISQKAVTRVNFLLSLISKHTEMAKDKIASEVMVAFLNDSGYLKYLVESDKLAEIDLLVQFHKTIKAFEETALDCSLKGFINQLNLQLEAQEPGKLEFDPEQGPDMVKIMTVHSAKGLEFKYVFVVSLVDRRFPCTERSELIEIPQTLAKEEISEGDVHLEEERRLFYVALTRAKKGLFLTSAKELKIKKAQADSDSLQPPASSSLAVEIKAQNLPLPEHFSFSQFSAFENCPYQYKLAFIFRVPSKGKASFSFGQSIHKTLNQFLRFYSQVTAAKQENLFGFKANSDIVLQKSNKTDLNELLRIYEQQWLDDWYQNKKQKQEYQQLGREILKNFYEQFSKNPPQVANVAGQLALELSFNLKIGNDIIKGAIDRIDVVSGGVRLLDYKTGQPKEKLDQNDKTQLLIYQAAAQEVFGLNPVELSYYYLENTTTLSFLGQPHEQQKLKEKISKQIQQIKQSDFKATPGWQCQFCDFREISHFAAEE